MFDKNYFFRCLDSGGKLFEDLIDEFGCQFVILRRESTESVLLSFFKQES